MFEPRRPKKRIPPRNIASLNGAKLGLLQKTKNIPLQAGNRINDKAVLRRIVVKSERGYAIRHHLSYETLLSFSFDGVNEAD